MIERHIRQEIVAALQDTPAVFVMGARRVGKSTLTKSIAEREHRAPYLSLDRTPTRRAARDDPAAFVGGLPSPVLLDEIQRAPDALLEIKDQIDQDPSPGRFLLTGPANIMTAPRIADALTGRVEIVTLWPLTQGEIEGAGERFVDALFEAEPPVVTGAPVGLGAFASRMAHGGYPEALRRQDARRRRRWFTNYLRTTLTRDLRDIATVRKVEEMPRLLRLLAARTGSVLHYDGLAGELGINKATVESYVGLLETIFLVRRLPAWRPGLSKRVVHAPKAYVVDCGLLGSLLGASEARIARDQRVTGALFESFIGMEIVKQLDWAEVEASPYHFRDRDDYEVDLVLEDTHGRVVGVEIKATASPSSGDFRGLRRLQRLAGANFVCGALVCTAGDTVAFGDGLWAVPISALWSAGGRSSRNSKDD